MYHTRFCKKKSLVDLPFTSDGATGANCNASNGKENAVKEIVVYTDGGCHGNPGAGGYGAVILVGGQEIVLSGGEAHTTNNRMELTAATKALEYIAKHAPLKNASITLLTDSQYVKSGITQWIKNWKKNNWQTAGKTPVKNKDLWVQLDACASCLDVTWRWVKGHAGITYNEMVDRLTQQEIAKFERR